MNFKNIMTCFIQNNKIYGEKIIKLGIEMNKIIQ